MKAIALCFALASLSAVAAPVTSVSEKLVNVARVVKVVPLVEKPAILVNVSVVDNGGSTDVSPTQSVFLNLYSKGEMFSTDAVIPLGDVMSFEGAKRVKAGIYEVKIVNSDLKKVTLLIDAGQATADIQKVVCEDEFDCAASTDFVTTVDVKTK